MKHKIKFYETYKYFTVDDVKAIRVDDVWGCLQVLKEYLGPEATYQDVIEYLADEGEKNELPQSLLRS